MNHSKVRSADKRFQTETEAQNSVKRKVLFPSYLSVGTMAAGNNKEILKMYILKRVQVPQWDLFSSTHSAFKHGHQRN